MSARRSTSDPISHYLKTGERVVWRHQPSPRALLFNRLPGFIIVVVLTAFMIVIGLNVVGSTIGPGPFVPDAWLILPAAAGLFFCMLLYFFLRSLWAGLRGILDSWSTHYALTDRRFMIVSKRGLIEYDASYFRVTEACGGAPGEQVLLFDYGPGRKRRDRFRDRIAAVPDSRKLKRLIQETLHA